MAMMRAIGLMSGTSLDGVDVALIETDGRTRVIFGPHGTFPYGDADRALLRRALADAVPVRDRAARPGALAAAETMVTLRHAEAIAAFLARHDLARDQVDVVGFHGQTVLHRPDDRLTIQIGSGPALAERLGLAVVSDFRAEDVAAGGQGAPLVPAYHRALVDRAGLAGPVALVNIGGVANITLLVPGRDPVACDSGPGNALIDDLMLERTGASYDDGGSVAAAGRVDPQALAALLAHPFFGLPAPKSLDRNAFSRAPVGGLATADAAATLVAFTVETIALTLAAMPTKPERVIVCGGGGHNGSLMRSLASRLACPLVGAAAMGWSLDAMEAQAFAYLAVRRWKSLPITFPTTTGVAAPLCGGTIDRP